MKRTGLASLALVLLFGCNTEVDSTPRPEQLEVAKAFVTHLGQGAFEEATRVLTPDLAKAMPAGTLEKTWEGLVNRFGPLTGFTGVRGSEASEFQILYVRGRHAHGELDVRLVFNGGKEISGLWFRPPDKDKTYAPLAIEIAAPAAPLEGETGAEPAVDGEAPVGDEAPAGGEAPVPADGAPVEGEAAAPTPPGTAPANAPEQPDAPAEPGQAPAGP